MSKRYIKAPVVRTSATSELITSKSLVSEGVNKQCLDTNVVESTTKTQNQILNSKFFSAGHIFTSTSVSTTVDVLFVPATTTHLNMQYNHGSDFYFYLYEGASVSSNGTTISSYSNNRVSSTASSAGVFHTPTLNTTGSNLLFTSFIPSILGKFSLGGNPAGPDIGGSEWVLSSSNKYLFRILNQGSNTVPSSILLSWYES